MFPRQVFGEVFWEFDVEEFYDLVNGGGVRNEENASFGPTGGYGFVNAVEETACVRFRHQ